jgi:hypothetical protein
LLHQALLLPVVADLPELRELLLGDQELAGEEDRARPLGLGAGALDAASLPEVDVPLLGVTGRFG